MPQQMSTVASINAAVTGIGGPVGDSSNANAGAERSFAASPPMQTSPPSGGGSGDDNPAMPYNQAMGVVTQSVAQSAAIAVADAADMLRNIETVMTTAMGVAMANWLKQPGNVLYEAILTAANKAIQDAAANFKTIGDNAAAVVSDFKL